MNTLSNCGMCYPGTSFSTKKHFYNSVCQPALLYGKECLSLLNVITKAQQTYHKMYVFRSTVNKMNILHNTKCTSILYLVFICVAELSMNRQHFVYNTHLDIPGFLMIAEINYEILYLCVCVIMNIILIIRQKQKIPINCFF